MCRRHCRHRCRNPSRFQPGSLVRAAGALSNVGEIGRVAEVGVDGRQLDLAGRRKPACGIDDAGPHRRRDAGAADYAPTVAVRDIIDPNAGIGVRVGGDVGCPPLAADSVGDRRLVRWTRFVLARAAAGRRPGQLRLQVAVCIAAVCRAAGRYDIRGSRGPDRPRIGAVGSIPRASRFVSRH